MKKLLVFVLLYNAVLSCITDQGKEETLSDISRHRVDSIVYANRNQDSLEVLELRFEAEGNKYGLVVVCRELGRLYRNSSRFSDALDVHKKGLCYAKEINDTVQIIQAYNNIGTDYRRMSILDEASSNHYNALTYSDAYSDKISTTAIKNRVVSLNGIGNVQLSLGNKEVADSVFRAALKGEKALGSDVGQAINYANIGAILESEGKVDSARVYYEKSLECNERAGSILGISLCHAHFGRLYENEKKYDLAIKEYTQSYDLLKEDSDKWHWLDACLALSRVHMLKGNLSVSWGFLREARVAAEDINSLDHLAGVSFLEYRLYEKEGKYKQSLESFVKSNEYRDKIADEKKLTHVQNVRIRYERERRRTEINQIQTVHRQEKERKDRIIISGIFALVFAALAIIFLIYILRLRSKNQEMMKEIDRTKTNFFTYITHEFRTPLTVILSAAQDTMEKYKSDKILNRNAGDIIKHGKGLLDLVNQILDIAKISSGVSSAPEKRRGDVIGFISMICEGHLQYAQAKDIRIVYDFESDHIEMDFIPSYMVRIVQNLLSNAIKFSDPGSEVYVSIKVVESEEGKNLQLYICDKGIGMTPEQKSQIFQAFYQAQKDTKNIGTGIGLPLVKLSVEAMDGNIDVHSYPGEGTVFIVTLPITRSADVVPVITLDDYSLDVADSVSADQLKDEDDGNALTPRILIVEDTPEVASWQMRQLTPGYNIYFAADGKEGLEKALEIVPDLIITDIMMPVMDGFELCAKVRSSELLSHIPVIMVTAKATQEDKLKGLQLGVDAYLEKPFNPTELSVRVEKLLEQREMLRRKFSENSSMEENKAISISIPDRAFLDKLSSAIHDMIESGNMDYDQLASDFCVGKTQLNRKIKAITGFTTTDYIHQVRISMAKQLLIKTNLPIGDIASRIGIDDVSYFSLLFRKVTGKTPSSYRSR